VNAAPLMLRMRHTLGSGAGLARSVVSDMPRKSFVTSIKTMRTGVITATALRRPKVDLLKKFGDRALPNLLGRVHAGWRRIKCNFLMNPITGVGTAGGTDEC
jgi:hypothetical protein